MTRDRELFEQVVEPTAARIRRLLSRAGTIFVYATALMIGIVAPLMAWSVPTLDRQMKYIMTTPPPPHEPVVVKPTKPHEPTPPDKSKDPVIADPDKAPTKAPDKINHEPPELPKDFGDKVDHKPGIPGDNGRGEVTIKQPPAVVKEQEPVHVGFLGVTEPRKLKDVKPIYPDIAKLAHVQGTVILEATIGKDGRVTNLRVIRSQPLLDQSALVAVRQWTFTPTLLNGVPVEVIMTVTVNFSLQ